MTMNYVVAMIVLRSYSKGTR